MIAQKLEAQITESPIHHKGSQEKGTEELLFSSPLLSLSPHSEKSVNCIGRTTTWTTRAEQSPVRRSLLNRARNPRRPCTVQSTGVSALVSALLRASLVVLGSIKPTTHDILNVLQRYQHFMSALNFQMLPFSSVFGNEAIFDPELGKFSSSAATPLFSNVAKFSNAEMSCNTTHAIELLNSAYQ